MMARLAQHVFTILCCVPQLTVCQPENRLAINAQENQQLSQFIGRYRMVDESVLIVDVEDGKLTARPILWKSTQFLRPAATDTFVVDDRPDRQLVFLRNSKGGIAAARCSGIGDTSTFPRLEKEPAPIELLFRERPQEACTAMVLAHPRQASMLVNVGKAFLRSFPSRAADATVFLRKLSEEFPTSSQVHSALADSYIATGRRASALRSYRDAYREDSTNEGAVTGLRRLNALPTGYLSDHGWALPFSLDSVFAGPTDAEIRSVETIWSKRDFSSPNPALVARYRLNLGNTDAEVRIIEYTVHGFQCYGAIVVPDDVLGTHAPVILELRGVAWNYPLLNLNSDLLAPRFLESDQGKFVYFVPSFRGEIIQINGTRYTSEGDRSDAFDGATDDALVLLNAAFRLTPEADTTRICAFGKSRGGTVALLAGIRDKRITSVLDWVGPMEWFELMGTGGWSQKELAADGLRMKATPREPGGQFIERFFKKSVDGTRGLSEVRLQMIASSPLYFARRLPRLEAHYGMEDDMVPIRNGEALRSALKQSGKRPSYSQFFFHNDAGHDLNRTIAFRESRKFVLELLQARQ